MIYNLKDAQKVYLGNQEVSKIFLQSFEVFSSSIEIDPYSDYVTLLTHFNADFSDYSTNNLTLSAFGNTFIDATIPRFGLGCVRLDGTGDYLQIEDNEAFGFGTGDFTIEAWVFPQGLIFGDFNPIIDLRTGTGSNGLVITCNSNRNITVLNPGGSQTSFTSINLLQDSTWNHLVVQRKNAQWQIFINGILDSSTIVGGNNLESSRPCYIGTFANNFGPTARYFRGQMDDIRITKGIARYTNPFISVPTSQYPDPTDPHINNVSLLLHMDGANGSQTFVDSSSNNFTLTRFGETQIATSVKKFGSGSAVFDGSSDYLRINSNIAFGLGNNFTIEAWVYPTAMSLNDLTTIVDLRDGGTQHGTAVFLESSTRKVFFYDGPTNNVLLTNGTVPLNTWTHIAAVRNGTTWQVYINGILDSATYTSSSNLNAARTCFIGTAADNPGGARNFTGYIDELRITKGITRYTSNFVPQTAPFANPVFVFLPTNISGLQLWLDGSDASTMYNATVGGFVVGANGAIARWEDKSGNNKHATQSTLNSRPLRRLSQQNGLDGVEFDGIDDVMEGSQIISSQPYTIIAVCKFTDNTEIGLIFGQTSDIPAFYKWGTGGNFLRLYNGLNLTSNSSLSNGPWYILRGVGNSSNSQIYINNVLNVTGSNGTNTPSGNYLIGALPSFPGGPYQGLVYGEIVVYNKVLTTEEASQIETYLNNKWNIY